MDVVPTDVPLDDLHLQLVADLTHIFPKPQADLAAEQLLAVLRDSYEVVLQVEPSMCGPSIVLNPPLLTEVIA